MERLRRYTEPEQGLRRHITGTHGQRDRLEREVMAHAAAEMVAPLTTRYLQFSPSGGPPDRRSPLIRSEPTMKKTLLLILAFTVGAPGLGSATETFPQYKHLRRHRAAGENPNYHVNRYGYGNYVQGPNGSIGGYPAGSGGARELEINQELKCRAMPESC